MRVFETEHYVFHYGDNEPCNGFAAQLDREFMEYVGLFPLDQALEQRMAQRLQDGCK